MGFNDVYEYPGGKADWIAHGLPTEGTEASEPRIGGVARTDVPTCSLEDKVGDVAKKVKEAGFDTCLVVNEGNIILGRLYQTQLDGEPDVTAGEVMLEGPSTFRPHVSTKEMRHFMDHHDLDTLPVSDSDGKLMGLVLRENLEA